MAELPSKLFFRIGEVAGLVGVEPHVLRYWEREFRSIRPTKSAKGQRVYSRKDVENLLRVRDLLYREGFTIAGAKKKLSRPDAMLDATPSSGERETLVDGDDEAIDDDLPPRPSEPAPFPRGDGRVREKLSALRAEVESYLDELTRAPAGPRGHADLRRRG